MGSNNKKSGPAGTKRNRSGSSEFIPSKKQKVNGNSSAPNGNKKSKNVGVIKKPASISS
jgi:hypothetical protein